jgi:hypothetical protein
MNEEYFEQIAVVQYLQAKYPKVLFTASAGGMRTSIGTAIKMKKMGYRRGCPDLIIFEPINCITGLNKYHGLLIEMKKKKGGTVSLEQKEFLQLAEERGYKAIVCEGAAEAIVEIDNYFGAGK